MPTVLDSLNQALHRALAANERVIVLGEDVLDPYGGAFRVTRGLSTAFPGQVLTTPISEAGIVGVATGMALRGFRPVVEIMFGDFVTLIADQLVNHAAKFRWMYNQQVQVPLLVRTPMGGRRGYGPTHSQTLEKLFLGTPGLRVVAPSAFGNPGDLLCRLILDSRDPTLFVENKLLYLAQCLHDDPAGDIRVAEALHNYPPVDPQEETGFTAPVYTIQVNGAPAPALTLVAYGYMAELARQALHLLAYEHEVFAELVVPTQLAPVDIRPLLASVQKTGRVLAIEEGTLTLGWGSEILARLAELPHSPMRTARRVAALETPVPASGVLEAATLPGVETIVRAALELHQDR